MLVFCHQNKFFIFIILITPDNIEKNINEKEKPPEILYTKMLLCFFPFLTNYCTCLKHMAGNEGNQKAKQRKGN